MYNEKNSNRDKEENFCNKDRIMVAFLFAIFFIMRKRERKR